MGRWHLSKDLKEVREQVLWTEHHKVKERRGQTNLPGCGGEARRW